MKRALTGIALTLAVSVAACSNGLELGTGLTGTMTRGPIAPVCTDGIPCSAPFAAHFDVYQGAKHVSAFDSDAGGNYSVRLAPGTYRIVPAANAPILDPTSHGYTVDVRSDALTVVNLEFDTGIR